MLCVRIPLSEGWHYLHLSWFVYIAENYLSSTVEKLSCCSVFSVELKLVTQGSFYVCKYGYGLEASLDLKYDVLLYRSKGLYLWILCPCFQEFPQSGSSPNDPHWREAITVSSAMLSCCILSYRVRQTELYLSASLYSGCTSSVNTGNCKPFWDKHLFSYLIFSVNSFVKFLLKSDIYKLLIIMSWSLYCLFSHPHPVVFFSRCEICGFTCRQKASLNWHMKKHDADTFYQFSCNICGKKFEKKDSIVAHKAKSHPEVLIAEALAANAGALITSTDILGTSPESIVPPTDGQGLPLLPDPLGNTTPGECLLLNPDGMPKAYCSGGDRVNLMADGKIFGSGSSETTEGLVMNTEILGATTEVLIEDSDSTGP